MKEQFQDYFSLDYQYFLDKVVYKRIENEPTDQDIKINCKDHIDIKWMDDRTIKVVLTRDLKPDAEVLFDLSVSFGAYVSLKSDVAGKEALGDFDIAEELGVSGGFIVNNLLGRMSLLIAEITSSYGQMPLVTPPTYSK